MIYIEGLHFSYGNTVIFHDFELASKSPFVVIKGHSGCGKTTLLKIISGNYTNAVFSKLTAFRRRTLVLQEDALMPWMSGLQNILVFLPNKKEELNSHPLYAHVAPYIHSYAFQMSFGQRRMIELLRVLLLKPDLLCLDEPFNFLDPKSRTLALKYLLKEVETSGMQIVMSTHYTETIKELPFETFYLDGSLPIRAAVSENESLSYA